MKKIFGIFRILLFPFSLFYGLLIYFRNLMYDLNLFEVIEVPKPVISVGNINTGGTGKTPTVEFIITECLKQNKKIAVLSRGYKRKTKGSLILSDGKSILHSSIDSGDEPFQIANKFRNCIVAVDEKRSRTANYLCDHYDIDLILLDDAFQHRSIKRDLDIVTMNYNDLPFDGCLLPAGRNRESLSSLKRADCVIINKCTDHDSNQVIENKLAEYTKCPVILSNFILDKIFDFIGNEFDSSKIIGKRVILFSGIAYPDEFCTLLEKNGVLVIKSFEFSDHHHFTDEEVKNMLFTYNESECDMIITTEKDYSRIISDKALLSNFLDIPIFYVRIRSEFLENKEKLLNLLKSVLN